MLKRIIQYISYDIWFKNEHEYSSKKVRWAVRQFKVILFTAQGLGEHGILVRSAALTFYTLMSLVPIAALVFGIAKGFGLETKLTDYFYGEFPQNTFMIDQITEFANALLQRTKGGIIASVGLVVLFWAVIKVFGNIEKAFNSIWEVRKSRSIARKFSDYVTVVVVAPILWIISSSAMLQMEILLTDFAPSPIIKFLFSTISLIVIWTLFAFLFHVMPNTKVKIRNAIVAGIVAGTAFQIFQVLYINIQSSLSSYNAIYGSFAAVPLFLIWMQASWQIVLFGAELSFAYQNINKFEYEKRASDMSYEYRKKAMLAVMQQIVSHFTANDGAVSSEMIAQRLDLPVRIVRDVIFDLEKAELIVSIASSDEKTNLYTPARDVHTIKVSDVIREVEASGKDSLEMEQSHEFKEINRIVEEMEHTMDNSPANILIMDIKIDTTKK